MATVKPKTTKPKGVKQVKVFGALGELLAISGDEFQVAMIMNELADFTNPDVEKRLLSAYAKYGDRSAMPAFVAKLEELKKLPVIEAVNGSNA